MNNNNKRYYSEEYIKGWEDGVKSQYEADIESVQGEWIDRGDDAECSRCGAHSGTQFDGAEPIPLKTKFCHNCGAKMTPYKGDGEE